MKNNYSSPYFYTLPIENCIVNIKYYNIDSPNNIKNSIYY